MQLFLKNLSIDQLISIDILNLERGKELTRNIESLKETLDYLVKIR